MTTHTNYADAAKQTVIDIKDYLNSTANSAFKKGAKISHQIEKSYPDIRQSVLDFTADAMAAAKSAFKSFGESTSETAHSIGQSVGKQFYRTEKLLLKVGILYAAYSYFFRNNDIVAEKSRALQQRIKSRPVESAFIALGTGYLLGRILR